MFDDLYLCAGSIQAIFSNCPAVEVVVAVAGTIALVVGVLEGFVAGVLIYHSISNHRSQSCKPEPSSNKQQIAGPIYEEVSTNTKLELRESVAYEPVREHSIKSSSCHGHVQH